MKIQVQKRIMYYLEKFSEKIMSTKEVHWSDDWDKAEYRIVKRLTDTGRCSYRPQRRLRGDWENLIGDTFASDTEADARHKIKVNREYYQNTWLRENSEKVEYIKVES